MKKLITLFFAITLTACGYIPATLNGAKLFYPMLSKQQYVTGTEDLPLFGGFKEVKEENISYDSVDGRIIDATFYSNGADVNEVRKFYEKTLPQLGWVKKQYQIYNRDGETLKLNILDEGKRVRLQFIIRPL